MYPDSVDGIIREVPFFVEYAGDLYPTFGAAMAFHIQGVSPNEVTLKIIILVMK